MVEYVDPMILKILKSVSLFTAVLKSIENIAVLK